MKRLKISIVISVACMLSACHLNTLTTADEYTANVQLEPVFTQSFKNGSIARVDISDDGEYLLAGGSFRKMWYWSTQNLNTQIEENFDDQLISLNFIGNDSSIFFANGIGVTRLFTNQFSKKIFEYQFPGTSKYSSVSNDTDLIAFGGYIYLRGQEKLLPDAVGHASQSSLQIGQQNNVLTSGYWDRYVALRDAGGNMIVDWQLDGKVKFATMSEDSKYVIASTQNGNCYVWEPPNKKASHRCDIWWDYAYDIHLNKTSTLFVLIRPKSISTYQLVPFKKLFTKRIDGGIRVSALSKDNWLAIGLDSGDVQLWDVLNGKLLATVKLSNDIISSVDVNQAAKLLMTGSYGGTVALYRINN